MVEIVEVIILAVMSMVTPLPEVQKLPCASVTNYWPFQLSNGEEMLNPFAISVEEIDLHLEGGYYWEAVPFNNQADSTPTITANGYTIDPYRDAGKVVAAPLPMINTYISLHEEILYVADTFGNPVYQAGTFYHEGYETVVIGIDILDYVPVHYLDCSWRIMK